MAGAGNDGAMAGAGNDGDWAVVPASLLEDLPSTTCPLCYREHQHVWRHGRGHIVDQYEMRADYWERPVAVVVVEETRFFHVRATLPMWRCDQMECVKRYWCEVIGELLGLFPYTREFHLEAQYDGGRVHRWAPAEERLYPYHMNGKFRVVYDVNPPTSRDVPAGTPPGWPAARVCAHWAEHLPIPSREEDEEEVPDGQNHQ